MPFDADVLVVGAGPIGCAVAVALAARGVDVAVVDRDPPGRDKVCGEGLMPHGVAAARRLGLPVDGPPFVGIRYVAGGVSAEGTFPGGAHGLGLRRVDSDRRIAAAAQAVAPVAHGTKVTGLSGSAGALVVSTTAGARRCRLVVGADGARSFVRRFAGLERVARGRRRWAVRRHHGWSGPLPDRVEVHLARGGEVYLTPVAPGVVNVALLLEDESIGAFRGDRDRAFDQWLAPLPLGARLGPALGPAAATGPLRQVARDVVADGVLLVGDAAGFVDGITGEGMSLGLEGAEVAAEIVAAACRTGRLAASDLAGWSERHRALVARSRRLTEVILAGIRYPAIASRAVAWLARRPASFDHLLAVDTGSARLRDLPLRARGRS
jgi:2-polyprenyl-6-methoxyphenol hydroxylase-like FAD-dependent oxidoreductase